MVERLEVEIGYLKKAAEFAAVDGGGDEAAVRIGISFAW
ncbi:hypothetical protein LINGRAHAP2_LOCUS30626 [Linum grandiflorum]